MVLLVAHSDPNRQTAAAAQMMLLLAVAFFEVAAAALQVILRPVCTASPEG